MQRDKYLAYLAEFDELMSQLENPQIARTMENAANHGMRVEEIAFFYNIPVASVEKDIATLNKVRNLTTMITGDLNEC
ncbi:hypothetical protein MOA67_gp016 [Klebsiella phage KpLz-2_45]|uniref:hypothetical protein n=1 Tax=Klebsiella phage KpLz-2_45 TaxID=2698923 RepID=UPI001F1466F2|nr:hypothetical protein MOA67_gp016 [Klebsiella phage KpLz-2_45]UKS71882.1 hypothetical protein KpLz245_0160 [Klebsiella phage KpLz-2_45]